jgi:hypothetical protein
MSVFNDLQNNFRHFRQNLYFTFACNINNLPMHLRQARFYFRLKSRQLTIAFDVIFPA